MLLIKLLKVFIQTDTNMSLQRAMSQTDSVDETTKQTYTAVVNIADKIKFKSTLTSKERVLAARYFRTLKNELSGKTVRYESANKTNGWVFNYYTEHDKHIIRYLWGLYEFELIAWKSNLNTI